MEMARLLGDMTSCDNGHTWDMVGGYIITQYTDSTGGQRVDCVLNFIQGHKQLQILTPVKILRQASYGY